MMFNEQLFFVGNISIKEKPRSFVLGINVIFKAKK